ncbi:MAG: hypothetical protein HY290_04505 [Planctomycetia bacterium]|nr:hypothetical protein [Planctomycetia bacterium]
MATSTRTSAEAKLPKMVRELPTDPSLRIKVFDDLKSFRGALMQCLAAHQSILAKEMSLDAAPTITSQAQARAREELTLARALGDDADAAYGQLCERAENRLEWLVRRTFRSGIAAADDAYDTMTERAAPLLYLVEYLPDNQLTDLLVDFESMRELSEVRACGPEPALDQTNPDAGFRRRGADDISILQKRIACLTKLESSLGALQQSFDIPNPSPLPPPGGQAQSNAFRMQGNDWFVHYDGCSFHLPDLIGAVYIHALLQKPKTGFTPHQLQGLRNESRLDPSMRSSRGAAQLRDDPNVERPSETSVGGPVSNHVALEEINERRKEIDVEIEKAKRNEDQAELTHLQVEKEGLLKELRIVKNPAGKLRNFQPQTKNERDAVIKAMKLAVKKIGRKNKELEEHLCNSLQYKDLIEYRPDRDVSWET